MHLVGSILALPKNNVIALDGQFLAHRPQPIHKASLTCSIAHSSLLQTPSVEHGGVSQRSVLPQQVVPLIEESSALTIAGAEINLVSLMLPQFEHAIGASSSNPF